MNKIANRLFKIRALDANRFTGETIREMLPRTKLTVMGTGEPDCEMVIKTIGD